MERHILFLIYPGFQLLELAGPMAAFEKASQLGAGRKYRLRTVSTDGGAVLSSSGVAVLSEAVADDVSDTFFVVGGEDLHALPLTDPLVGIVARLSRRTRRTASVCTGAFILAAAGLLNGRRATTHWRWASQLQKSFPDVKVEGNHMFLRDGAVWTSAGVTSGIDLALALIEQDGGAEICRTVSRRLVFHHQHPGGQAQYADASESSIESVQIRAAVSYASQNLAALLSVERLAEIARLSPRHFSRAFLHETGETPAKAVERMRVVAARRRIETSQDSIDAIAGEFGMNPERMRRAFLRTFGQPPQGMRRLARMSPAGIDG